VDGHTAIALPVALASTTLTNLAYLQEHDAAASLPALSLRRPLHSAALLLREQSWLKGFALEGVGFALYVLALALAPLTLVQSVSAGGIGILAFLASRLSGLQLLPHEVVGVAVSVLGLVLLGVSLAGATGEGSGGSTLEIVLWLAATAAAAVIAIVLARASASLAAAYGVAGGLLFSIGDISTKVATQGGARTAFAVTVVAGYLGGTALLQLGYQRGDALTVAGLATLFTNALPIAAGSIVLGEPTPSGALGVVRSLAFGAVTLGAILLSRAREPAHAR
jgi:hypothetical protein